MRHVIRHGRKQVASLGVPPGQRSRKARYTTWVIELPRVSQACAFSATVPEADADRGTDVVHGALVIARQEEQRRSELELGALAEVYRAASADRTVRDVVDVVTGSAAVGQPFRQLHAGTRDEVLAFVLPAVLTDRAR